MCVCLCVDCRGFRLSLELDFKQLLAACLGCWSQTRLLKDQLALNHRAISPAPNFNLQKLFWFEVYEHMFIHNVLALCLQRPEDNNRSFGTGVTGRLQPPQRCWEPWSSTKSSACSQPLIHLSNPLPPPQQNYLPVHSHTCTQIHFSWFLLLVIYKQKGS